MTFSRITKERSEQRATYLRNMETARQLIDGITDVSSAVPRKDLLQTIDSCIDHLLEQNNVNRYLTDDEKDMASAVQEDHQKLVSNADNLFWFRGRSHLDNSPQIMTYDSLISRNPRADFASIADIYQAIKQLYEEVERVDKSLPQRIANIPAGNEDMMRWVNIPGHIVRLVKEELRPYFAAEVVTQTKIDYESKTKAAQTKRVTGTDERNLHITQNGIVRVTRQPYNGTKYQGSYARIRILGMPEEYGQFLQDLLMTEDDHKTIATLFAFASGVPEEEISLLVPLERTTTRYQGRNTTQKIVSIRQYGSSQPNQKNELVIHCGTPRAGSGCSFMVDRVRKAMAEHYQQKRREQCTP